MKHHAPQFTLPAMPEEQFQLVPETASQASTAIQPTTEPGQLFTVALTFAPTKMDKQNKQQKGEK